MTTPSVAVHHDNGRLWCQHGDISHSWVSATDPGVITGMGPLLLITDPIEEQAESLARYGVTFTVDGDLARTEARNGTWVHQLRPAHWHGDNPAPGWAPRILLGRWPD